MAPESDPSDPTDSDRALDVQLQWLRLLRVSGDLDLASAHLLHQAAEILAEQPAQDLVVDLAALTFVDAAGLGALMVLVNAQQQAGATLSFVGTSAMTREFFSLADAQALLAAADLSRSA